MSKTITRLFDSHTEALSAVEALERAGVDHNKISLVSNNADNWHAGHKHAGGAPGSGGPLGDRNGDGENDVADGAGKGATTGGLVGGGAGLLAGLGMLAIPGLGPVVAAGWLVSTAVGAAIGAGAADPQREQAGDGRRGEPPPDQFRRRAADDRKGRHIGGDHGTGGNNGSPTDFDIWQNN